MASINRKFQQNQVNASALPHLLSFSGKTTQQGSHSALFRFLRRLTLSSVLATASFSVCAVELYEVFMESPEHLAEASAVCLSMHEDQYQNSLMCDHAIQAIHLLKLQELQTESQEAFQNLNQFAGQIN